MDLQKKSLRIGALVIVCAVLLRLLGGGLLDKTFRLIANQEVASLLLFLETGRVVITPQIQQKPAPSPTEPTIPDASEGSIQAVFSASDAENVVLYNLCGYKTDIPELLASSLVWNLKSDEPTVLIVHTHATEGYLNTENYEENGDFRTLDTNYNMVCIGKHLAQKLEEGGIRVLHDETLHDYPSYNGAYGLSRETVQEYLQKYPSIKLVLDLHRDAIADTAGNQIGYTAATSKGTAAKMMLVMGSDAGGLEHPYWQENLSLAVKLQALLEKENPGICRPISLRTSRYNQDLFAGSVLVEMGAAGNSRQEALVSAELLADAILSLAYGATYLTEDSTS